MPLRSAMAPSRASSASFLVNFGNALTWGGGDGPSWSPGNDYRDLSEFMTYAAGGCMARSLIGITGQLEAAHWGDWVREAVLSPLGYARAVERAGGTPVILPPVPADSVARLTQSLDGIVFTCGTDVNPALYDAVPHEKTGPPDRRRDRFEVSLVRAATDAQLPFLAICRGMHVLNVALGGTLIQHLPDAVGHNGHAPDPYKMAPHDVHLDADSTVGRRLGSQARVPALHHQAVCQAGEGLVTVAWADDQVIEAVELQGHPFAVGVQWHPEEGDDLRLFEALIEAAQAATSARAAARAAENKAPKQPAGRGGRTGRAAAKARARI
jgi:putative glutamine amidotransferase